MCTWHASDLWTDGKYPLVNIYTAFTKPFFQSVIGALQMFIIAGIDPCLSMQRLDPGKVNWKTRQQNSLETLSYAKLKVYFVFSNINIQISLSVAKLKQNLEY